MAGIYDGAEYFPVGEYRQIITINVRIEIPSSLTYERWFTTKGLEMIWLQNTP
jgi:hypothetical protein